MKAVKNGAQCLSSGTWRPLGVRISASTSWCAGACAGYDGNMRASFRLGRIAGVPVGVNWSVLVIFVLIAWALSASLFPSSYPGHSPVAYIAAGLAAVALPDTGWEPSVFAVLTVVYVLLAGWYWYKIGRIGNTPREV